MPAKLVDEHSHFEYEVPDGVIAIGRMPENDISLAGNAVSRYHAKLRKEGEKWWLEDLGSRNGTFVNGRKIEAPAELKDGDKVVLGITRTLPNGEYSFTFRTAAPGQGGPAAPTVPADKAKSTVRTVVERRRVEIGRMSFERKAEVLVVRMAGVFTKPEVDAFRAGLVRELGERPLTTVLDLSGVTSINSYGLAVLVEMAAGLSEKGKALRTFGAQGSVKKLLLMPGEGNPIALCASEAEALRGG